MYEFTLIAKYVFGELREKERGRKTNANLIFTTAEWFDAQILLIYSIRIIMDYEYTEYFATR